MNGLSDTQFGVLVSVLGVGLAGIGTAIRFAASRIINALDKNSTAMIENTISNTKLSTKIDNIAGYIERREKDLTPVEGVPIPRGEYRQVRKRSEPGTGEK